jgi:uncharacterized membrane protein YvbJ
MVGNIVVQRTDLEQPATIRKQNFKKTQFIFTTITIKIYVIISISLKLASYFQNQSISSL